ncbi:MAG: hypothetical protein JST00_03895 [Deltaproteobacteria bacterium]|nr:hypothetical protein [Deltaproteobacteria bacterium]
MTPNERLTILRFAASFLWADLEIDAREAGFFADLARELGLGPLTSDALDELLAMPPLPEDIDPTSVPPALAARVRDAALRAIASDGKVLPAEMAMFELLDELLPRQLSPPG